MRLIDSRAGVTAQLEMWDSFICREGDSPGNVHLTGFDSSAGVADILRKCETF